MLSDAEYELERELNSLRAELIRERRARELRAEVSLLAARTSAEADRSGVAQVIADGASALFDAGWAMVAYVGEESTVHIKHGSGVPLDVARDWSEVPLDTAVPLCDVLRNDVAEVVLENRGEMSRWPLMVRESGRARFASIAVRRVGRVGGAAAAIAVAWPHSHSMDATERELLELLAGSVAPAFDRSGRTEVHGEVARTLQQWVLNSRPADVPHVDIETLYEPGSDLLAVGGDWFDVIELADGQAAVVVGDVVGHDVEAAVAMSQVRHVLAAHLVAGNNPAAAMDRTDAYLRRRTRQTMATAVVIVFEGDGVIRVASAGHPPPIVDVPGRGPEPLAAALGPPLGTGLGTYDTRVTRLPAGSTIVAYTDGLVERRGESVDRSIDELTRSVRSTISSAKEAGRPIAAAVAAMLRSYGASAKRVDDVAAVVMHLRTT